MITLNHGGGFIRFLFMKEVKPVRPHEIIELLRGRYKSISAFATEKGVPREMVYQSVKGGGSRSLRIVLALELKKSPSDLWPSQSSSRRLDDEAYSQALGKSAADSKVDSPWLNFEEAVAYLRYGSSKTLRNLVSRSLVPHVKEPTTGALRFHKPTLDAWLKQGAK